MEDYLTLDLKIKENQVEGGAKEILQNIRPNWKPENIRFKYFTEGITNTLIGCYLDGAKDDMVLVRIYGPKTELLINRDVERVNIVHLYKHQLSPPLYCAFSNGLAYGFIPGKPVDEVSVRKPEIATLIAKELARLHSIPLVNGSGMKPDFSQLNHILSMVPESYSDADMQKRFTEQVPPKAALMEEGKMLQGTLASLGSPVVFTHNDLLLQNIIYDQDNSTMDFPLHEWCTMFLRLLKR